jgi:ATP-binding protein involved in chromosome partitioning
MLGISTGVEDKILMLFSEAAKKNSGRPSRVTSSQKNRGYFMSNIDDNMNGGFKKDADRALLDQKIRKSMSSIKHKILALSCQGGVGKTSVIVNLAMTLSKRGLKVGLMDVNFHSADIHKMLGLEIAFASDSDKRLVPVPHSDDLKVASIAAVMQDSGGAGVWGRPVKISVIHSFISSMDWGSLDYLFIDTPPGPGEKLLALIRGIPEAEIILVTAPNKICRDRAKEMIYFFKEENIPIFGWIENMRGFLCQHCGQIQELFSTGSGGRAVFLMDIPFLGRIPIDPYLSECVDAGEPFLEKYPDSQVAEAYNLIGERILEDNKEILSEDKF